MNKTFRISFSLRTTYKVNSILYALKRIPLIGKLLPASLYREPALKMLGNVIAALWEFGAAFFGKFLYLLCMVFLMRLPYADVSRPDLFLHILFWLSIAGAIMNTYLFNPTRDKYYAIVLLRMDARAYTLVNYGYALAKLLVGFLAFGLLFGLLADVPLVLCVLIPFFVVGLKLSFAAYSLRAYERHGTISNENVLNKWSWLVIGLALAAAYLLPICQLVLPMWATALLMLVPIVTGALSLRWIFRFAHYRECYQQLLQASLIQQEAAVQVTRKQSNQAIVADTGITSHKRGFEYLNELFIKRHRKLLWRSVERVALVCTALIAVMLTCCWRIPTFRSGVNEFLMRSLPVLVFVMYLINRGMGFSRVLFMNCDHSLLTYPFFKQPKNILRLFRIRLREITKINLLPAGVIGCGLALLLFASGGTADPLNYVVLLLSVPALSVFFSVHYLTIYYLLQPYNAGTEIKSATFQIANTITYLVCFYVMQAELPTLVFGALTILFCMLYSIVACILVYKIAPKTFRLRE